ARRPAGRARPLERHRTSPDPAAAEARQRRTHTATDTRETVALSPGSPRAVARLLPICARAARPRSRPAAPPDRRSAARAGPGIRYIPEHAQHVLRLLWQRTRVARRHVLRRLAKGLAKAPGPSGSGAFCFPPTSPKALKE